MFILLKQHLKGASVEGQDRELKNKFDVFFETLLALNSRFSMSLSTTLKDLTCKFT